MIARRRFILLAALAAGSLAAAAAAGAATTGTATAQSGFSVENLLMELSVFLPGGVRGILRRPRDSRRPAGRRRGRRRGAGQPAPGQPAGHAAPGRHERAAGHAGRAAAAGVRSSAVQARRQADVHGQASRRASPRAARPPEDPVSHTVAGEEGHHDRRRHADQAAEGCVRQVREGARQGDGGDAQAVCLPFRQHGNAGCPGQRYRRVRHPQQRRHDGQAGQGQRQQVDPAELRRQMLEGFIETLLNYRKGLK